MKKYGKKAEEGNPEQPLSRGLLIGGWLVVFLWFVLVAMLVGRGILPYVIDPLVGKVIAAKDARQLLRHLLTNVAFIITSLCTYYPLNWLLRRLVPGITLWEWFSKVVAQTVQQPKNRE